MYVPLCLVLCGVIMELTLLLLCCYICKLKEEAKSKQFLIFLKVNVIVNRICCDLWITEIACYADMTDEFPSWKKSDIYILTLYGMIILEEEIKFIASHVLSLGGPAI